MDSWHLMIGAIALLSSVGVIYGTRQSPRRKAIEWQEGEQKQESFWKYFKAGFSNQSYVAYLCFYIGNKIWDQFRNWNSSILE